MHEVIQKVIAAEAEARGLVEAAKAQANRLLLEAEKQGQNLIAQVRQESRVEADRIVKAAILAAEREKQERLARVACEIEAKVRLDADTQQRAVTGAILSVCGLR